MEVGCCDEETAQHSSAGFWNAGRMQIIIQPMKILTTSLKFEYDGNHS